MLDFYFGFGVEYVVLIRFVIQQNLNNIHVI